MKIAIGICEKVNGICSTMGCFNAFNNNEGNFKQYNYINKELVAFFTCEICSSKNTKHIEDVADKLKKTGVDRLHLGVCVVKCEEGKFNLIKKIFNLKGIIIEEGTH